jgi:UDP-glucose 4-epimerase
MPERIPIEAEDRIHPLNPYGESKWMVEQILRWYSLFLCDHFVYDNSIC